MADEQQVVRDVSWQEVFGFSHIFKSFKMARDPGKILLALAAIVLTYGLGRLMDVVWSVNESCVVEEGETWEYWKSPNRAQFLESKRTWLEETRVNGLSGAMVAARFEREEAAEMVEKDFDGAADALRKKYREDYQTAQEAVEAKYEQDTKATKEKEGLEEHERKADLETHERERRKGLQEALQKYVGLVRGVDKWTGRGIFAGFLDWEMECLRNGLGAIRRGRFVSGVSTLYTGVSPQQDARGALRLDQYKDQVPNVPGVATPGP
ncbi:MAG: hypothetical protein ACYTGB_20255, partial [Planctomycetota bacterium]